MAVIDVYNLQNEKTSQMELKEEIFGVPVKKHVLHQVVVSQLNNRRSGSAKEVLLSVQAFALMIKASLRK